MSISEILTQICMLHIYTYTIALLADPLASTSSQTCPTLFFSLLSLSKVALLKQAT